MRVLLLIPSVLKTDIAEAVAADRHPHMDYYALSERLRDEGAQVDLVGYRELEAALPDNLVLRGLRNSLGADVALAYLGYLRRREYAAIFSNGENVSIPLGLFLSEKRPRHVTIGHRLSARKKRFFFRTLGVQRHIDTLFVYASVQEEYARHELGIAPGALRRISFHADTQFYRPLPEAVVQPRLVCSAGLEWRDYPTLIEAVAPLPDIEVKLAAASPWSKHTDETARQTLPPFVMARRYEYGELRALYAASAIVVVPLYENDFQAGVTTILEAMAMGKPVVATRTEGQRDVIEEGRTGLYVPPGDAAAWRASLTLLLNDPARQAALGEAARQWVRDNASLTLWTHTVAQAICGGSVSGTNLAI